MAEILQIAELRVRRAAPSALRGARFCPALPPAVEDEPEVRTAKATQATLRHAHELIEAVGPGQAARMLWEAFKLALRAYRRDVAAAEERIS